ncbi:bifunctional folylpolyglutamate synthase/dihydrofolate synthase, partial [Staphylococcus pseudintermedius]
HIVGQDQKENAARSIATLSELYQLDKIHLDFNKRIDGIEHGYWTGHSKLDCKEPLIRNAGANKKVSECALE